MLGEETFEKGLNNAAKDNDLLFPEDWRLSMSSRPKKEAPPAAENNQSQEIKELRAPVEMRQQNW